MLALLSEAKNPIPGGWFNPALFREPKRAWQDVERIRARTSEDLAAAMLGLLSDSPDPDQALSLCEKLVMQGGETLLHLLDRNRVLLHYAIVVFGHSYWLGEALLRNSDLLDAFSREKSLERSLDREDYRQSLARLRSSAIEADLPALLARFKKREYIRILLRDALGIATLAETAEEISALADVIIAEALEEALLRIQKRYGHSLDVGGRTAEAAFSVVALGKLGGNELNYSSDLDLLYLYDERESSGSLSLREYFVRLAHVLTGILSHVTEEGAPFRIDLRLRPQGHEGEPALGLRRALDYYAHDAQDWELQALIKARHSAGDAALTREFIRGVQRQVYTEDLNFEAIETALQSREKMGARRQHVKTASKTPAAIDVKLDRGGIRDIEFLVQCLQRVYGGAEPWLRSGGTLFSLQKLHDKGHLGTRDFHELTVAYEFLRRIEHRLQLQRGLQVHRLPQGSGEIEVLQRAVSREASGEGGEAFLRAVRSQMAAVAEIYDRVIRGQRNPPGNESTQVAAGGSEAMGIRPWSADQMLQDFPEYAQLVEAAGSGLSLHARRALRRFLGSAITGADRHAALLENPALVRPALVLFETSEYLTDVLVQHPDELHALEGLPRSTAAETGVSESTPPAGAADDLGKAMTFLRRSFRKKVFVAAAQDVLAPRPAMDSMRETSTAADVAIRAALRVAGGDDILAVFALGRLGTHEFDIGSDADLLFVRDPQAGEGRARAAAEKLIHTLAAYTREGALFAVDARLRPRGGEGELVVTRAQLENYLAEEAQPWEALSYTKLRFVAGREDIRDFVLPAVWRRIVEMKSARSFPNQVVEMRGRLEKSNRYPRSFKLASGGFYDIDFIVSFLPLKEGPLAHGNTIERLDHLWESGLLKKPAFTKLKEAAVLYRTVDHVIRLVTGRARPELPEAEHARRATVGLVNKILRRKKHTDLQAELKAAREEVREIFVEVLRSS